MRCAVIVLRYERILVIIQVEVRVGCISVGILARSMVITGKGRVGRKSYGCGFVQGDWVMFARYAGSRFRIDGGEVRILNDDEILATIQSPEDVLHF